MSFSGLARPRAFRNPSQISGEFSSKLAELLREVLSPQESARKFIGDASLAFAPSWHSRSERWDL